MKFRITVTIDIADPELWGFSEDGDAMEPTGERISPERIASHAAASVHSWGGQLHPNDTLFPSNINYVEAECRGVKVRSEK